MRTLSFDRGFPRLSLVLTVACLVLAAPPSARAKGVHGTIEIGPDGDSTDVREITIDDEGIRVVGGDKRIDIPATARAHNRIQVDRNLRGHRIIRIDGDSLGPIVINGHGDNEVVQFFKDVHVERGETVGTVVALFGSVRNDGVITGDCVAILGSIVQGDSAVIQGDAVSIGGSIEETGHGARIDGQTVSGGFLPFSPISMPGAAGLLVLGAISFLLFVALAALAGRLFPERLVRIAETISRRTFLSLILGLMSGPLGFVLFVLLLVTVIGIPLALLLPFLFVLAAFVGYIAATYLLGTKLLGRRLDPALGIFAPVAAGTALVTLFYLLGVAFIGGASFLRLLGVILLSLWVLIGMICWMLGFGALLLSRLGQKPRSQDREWYPSATPSPPGPPRPATPAPTPTAPQP